MKFLITLATVLIFSSLARADSGPLIMEWGIAERYGFVLEVTGGVPFSNQSLNPPIGTLLTPSPNAAYGYVIFNELDMNIWAANGTLLGSIIAKTKYVAENENYGMNYPYATGNFTGSTYLQDATLAFTYDESKSTLPNDGNPYN